MWKHKYTINLLWALLAGSLVSAIVFFAPTLYETFEVRTLDLRFQLRGAIHQRNDIVFIEIDDASIQALGRWPWPRDSVARITDELSALKAKAILFDVIFSEPSQLVIDKEKMKEALAIADPETMRQTVGLSLQDNDALLAASMKKAGNVYLGAHFDIYHSALDRARRDRFERLRGELSVWIQKNPSADFSEVPSDLMRSTEFTSREIKELFITIKLHYLLGRNIELPFEEAALYFEKEDTGLLRRLFQEAKASVLRQRIDDVLKTETITNLSQLAGFMGIFNPQDEELLQRIYAQMRAEESFAAKAGIVMRVPDSFFQAADATFAIPEFLDAMKASGHLNAVTDNDGTLRKVPLLVRFKDRVYPHLAFRYICDMWGIDIGKDVRIEPGKKIIVGSRQIPIDENGCMLLNWAGTWQDSFGHISASKVHFLWELEHSASHEDAQKKEAFMSMLEPQVKDKICIIGLTAAGTQDFKPIPLESNYPAVGTYGTILNSVLEGTFLSRVSSGTNYALIFLCAIAIALVASALPVGISFVCGVGVLVFYGIFSFILFGRHGIWIDVIGPFAGGILSYVSVISYRFSVEAKEKRWVKKAFSHYISKDIMEEILKDPSKLSLGGQSRELTFLFSDIRGFTSYSEKHRPEEVVSILNEYLNEMSAIVFRHDGTLDKYVGDEIVVFFGAPVAQADHARRAVCVALEMIAALKILQEKWRSQGRDILDIGIGINTGWVIVGNMGSMERMNYTAIGDAVNLASRIQGLTRTYNNHIIISEFTYALVKDFFSFKPLEAIKVKGKENPVMMYEVLGYSGKR